MRLLVTCVISLALLGSLRADCGEGTLKCNTIDTPVRPEICDFKNNYVLSPDGQSCKFSRVDGCELATISESIPICFLCKAGYVIDVVNLKCVVILEINKVTECFRYNPGTLACEVCNTGFYLEDIECKAVPADKTIANCDVYLNADTCKTCASKHYLKDTKCVAFDTLVGCKTHTNKECTRCQSGFIGQPRQPHQYTLNDSLKLEILTDQLTDASWVLGTEFDPFCRQFDVTNCLSFDTFQTCGTCSPGFFLTDAKQCQANPLVLFPNCGVYKDKDTCLRCKGPYFLAGTPPSCQPITAVDSCMVYEINRNYCSECLASHWFDRLNNKCILRLVKNVAFCTAYDLFSDKCLGCSDALSLTVDTGKCLPDITNCSTQIQGSNSDHTTHICQRCADKYYLKEDTCVERDLLNCVNYEVNLNECKHCEAVYYVDSDKHCQLRNAPYCTEYAPDSNDCVKCEGPRYASFGVCRSLDNAFCETFTDGTNNCQICEMGYYKSGNVCVAQDKANCELFNKNLNTCQQCFPGYYKSGSDCLKQNTTHCYEYLDRQSTCTKCSQGYYLSGSTCLPVSKANCISYTPNTNTCLTCAKSHWLNPTSVNDCLDRNQSNCTQYDATTNVCNKCQKGYYKNGSDACVLKSGSNCIQFNAADSVCTGCAGGYWLNGSDACVQYNIDSCILFDSSNGECTTCASGYWPKSTTECAKFSGDNCIAFNSTTGVCTTCAVGFWLNGSDACVQHAVSHCLKHDPTKADCLICKAGYWLSSNNLTCNQLVGVNCINFDMTTGVCSTCASGYWKTVTNTCTQLNVPGCVVFNMTNGTCTKCQAGKYKNSDGNCMDQTKANCIKYTPNTNDCDICALGYYQDSLSCSPQSVPSCVKYTANTNSCLGCSMGYLLASASLCDRIDTSTCLGFNSNGNCNECPADKYLDGSDCKLRDKIHCISFAGNTGDCELCQEGFYIDADFGCSRHSSPNCVNFLYNTNTCVNCQFGYFLKDNNCIAQDIGNCVEHYKGVRECKLCMAGYYLATPTSCLQVNNTGCITFHDNTNICIDCAKDYHLESPTCVKNNIPNCLAYNSEFDCTICEVGHYLEHMHTPVDCTKYSVAHCTTYVKLRCTICAMGYYISHASLFDYGTCTAMTTTDCLKYEDNKNICLVCEEGKYLSSPTQCDTQNQANCIEYTPNTNDCLSCPAGTHFSSGNCLDNNKDHCIEYTPNTNNCLKCEAKWRKDGDNCSAQNRSNCVEFIINTNDCKTCKPRYYLNGTGCTFHGVSKCVIYTRNTNSCEQCQAGHYLKSKSECVAHSLTGCITYVVNTNKCTVCSSMYELVDDDCVAIPTVSDCLIVKGSDETLCDVCALGFYDVAGVCTAIDFTTTDCKSQALNLNKCGVCYDGKMVDAAGDCVAAMANCSELKVGEPLCVVCDDTYGSSDGGATCSDSTTLTPNCRTHDPTTTTCTRCLSKFYVDGSDCTAITTTANCYESEGYTNICSKCNKDYHKDGVDGDCTEARDAGWYDANCVYNIDTILSPICAECPSGFHMINGPIFRKPDTWLTDNFCAILDINSGNCRQCIEYYEFDDEPNQHTCVPAPYVSPMVCKQIRDNVKYKLMENKGCAKCVNDDLHYITYKTASGDYECVSRQQFAQMPGCLEWNASSLYCTQCSGGSNFRKSTGVSFQAIHRHDMNIDNCVVNYTSDIDSKEYCQRCVGGMKLNENGLSCIQNDYTSDVQILRTFSATLGSLKPQRNNAAQIDNCNHYAQIDETRVGCTVCRDGFVGIVDNPMGPPTNRLYAYTLAKHNSVSFDDVVNVFKKCVPDHLSYQDNAGVPVTNSNSCKIGFEVGTGKVGFACIRCRDWHMGVHGLVYKDANGLTLDSSTSAIIKCKIEATMEMTKVHGGFYFNLNITGLTTLLHSTYLPWDTCPSGKKLVYMFVTANNNRSLLYPNSILNSGLPYNVAYCLDDSIVPAVAGCQVYALNGNFAGGQDITTTLANSHCLVCQPRFQYNAGACTDMTAHCDAIDNDFLGGCRNPSKPQRFDKAVGFAPIPDSATAIADNCMVQSTDGSEECWLCEPNHTWVTDKCYYSNIDKQCDGKFGHSFLESTLHSTDAKKLNTFANLVWRRWEDSLNSIFKESFRHDDCIKYNNNWHAEWYINLMGYDCSNASAADEKPDNCIHPNTEDPTKCKICDASFILSSSKTCTAQSAHTNCKYYSSNDDWCSICDTGYERNPTSPEHCILSDCKEWNLAQTPQCIVCNDNKGLTHGNRIASCTGADTSANDCINFSAYNRACVKCRDPTKTPTQKKTRNNSNNDWTIALECIAHDLQGTFSPNHSAIDYIYLTSYVTTSGSANNEYIDYPLTFENKFLRHKGGFPNSHFNNNYCVPSISTIANCTSSNLYFCKSCADRTKLNRNLASCDSPLANCIKHYHHQNYSYRCSLCEDTHYVDSGSCVVRTDTTNCIAYNAGHSCTCDNGFWWDGANEKCEALSAASGCLTNSINSDKCTSCLFPNFPKSDGLDCSAIIGSNCGAVNNYGSCIGCGEGMFPSGGSCIVLSNETCLTFKPNENKCLTCSTNYEIEGNNCGPKDTNYCLTYSTTADTCATCSSHFYQQTANKKCYSKSSPNCGEYDASNLQTDYQKCASCKGDNYVFDGAAGTCTLKATVDCLEYNSGDTDTCKTCAADYYDNGSGACLAKSIGTCKTFNASTAVGDKDKCETCQVNRFVKSTDACVQNTSRLCKKYSATANGCEECQVGYLLSGTTCTKYAAVDCKTWNPTEDKCATCPPGYWLNGINCAIVTATYCLTFDFSTGKCATCHNGFWLTGAGNCDKNTATGCVTFLDNLNKCASCHNNFKFDAANSSCIPKVAIMCEDFKTDSDACDSCKAGYIFDEASGSCLKSRATDCATAQTGAHECATCSRLYFLDDDKSCKLRDAMNCNEYETTNKDECKTCKPGFVLNSATKFCDPNAAPSCRTYKAGEHKCATCSESFFMAATEVCEANDAVNCMSFKTTGSGCATCPPLTFFQETDACTKNDRTGCLNYKPGANECDQCSENFKLDGTSKSCVPRTATNCNQFDVSSTDKCSRCELGFYIDGDNCSANSSTNCHGYKFAVNQCNVCTSLFYKSGSSCVPNDSDNCGTFDPNNNKCFDCLPGYKFDGSSKSCVNLTANLCQAVSLLDNKCDLCSDGFVFSDPNCVMNNSTHCKEFDRFNERCRICEAGYYINGNNCDKIDRTLCDTFKVNQNQCATCKEGFFVDASKNCTANNGQFCDTWDPNAHGCATCTVDFYLSGTNCTPKDASNCTALTAGQLLDQCSTCGAGYVLNNSTKLCVANVAQNCADFNPTEHKCANCNIGFFKNGANQDCVAITALHCKVYNFNVNECDACVRGWVKEGANNECVANTGQNCLVFKESVHGCESCRINHWKDLANNDLCKPYAAKHCLTFEPTNDECLTCLTGYFLNTSSSPNICALNNAQFCETRSTTEEKCTSCLPGYYINATGSGLCVTSSAINCASYAPTTNHCATCKAGYLTVVNGDNTISCNAYTASLCDTYKIDQDQCINCKSEAFASVSGSGSITCIPRLNTDCVDFLPTEDGCKKCPDEQHVDVNKACAKLSLVKHCLQFALDKDECIECESGYYTGPAGNECLPNPSGIANCTEYLNERRCWKCNQTHYLDLEHNQCNPVLVPVSGCIEYLNATICNACQVGSKLMSNVCKLITATDCAFFVTDTTCESCVANYVLHPVNRTCDPSGIANCLRAIKSSPKDRCELCEPGFLLNDDLVSCSEPTTKIENCLDYEDQTTCKECNDSFVLAVDKQSCVAMTVLNQNNCTRGFITEKNTCDRCHYGFELSATGQCSLLKVSKCAILDQKTGKCILCAPGTNMDEKEQCNGTPSDLAIVPTDVIDTNRPTSAGIWTVFTLVIAFGLVHLSKLV